MAAAGSLVGVNLDDKVIKSIGKYALIIIGIIILIIVVVKVKKYITEKVRNQSAVKEASAEIDTSQLTMTEAQYSSLADKLYIAMKGWGTDNKAVYAVFESLNTRSDLMKLITVYGLRDGETLMEWLYGDLNQKEINHVNSILESKNINYKF